MQSELDQLKSLKPDEALKLRCLELAIDSRLIPSDIVEYASRYYSYIKGEEAGIMGNGDKTEPRTEV